MAVPGEQAERIERLRSALDDPQLSGDLDALAASLSEWEERAREDEAEVAMVRWELRLAGEKITALVQRLLELENAPTRRLRRLLRSEPTTYSHTEITRAVAPEIVRPPPE
jgi:predicted  nucleic acid-binding Zn-ribbon protein